jgi:hypothetical protein
MAILKNNFNDNGQNNRYDFKQFINKGTTT